MKLQFKLKPLVLLLGLAPAIALASSHREAPFITSMPQVDGTDFYMFMSYEPGREGYVTLIANYDPFQDPFGGPIFFPLSNNAVYDIYIDNDGDGAPNLTYRFNFTNTYKDLAVPAGGARPTSVPLLNVGPVSSADQSALNRIETYTVEVREKGGGFHWLTRGAKDGGRFTKPVDNIGNKSIADYPGYSGNLVYDVEVPGCSKPGRVFVGQRKEGFVVNVGEIFDLINLNPLGPRDGAANALSNKNVTTLALELPASCLVGDKGDPVIGGYTTVSIPGTRTINPGGDGEHMVPHTAWRQVSRVGQPLVNEVVIGMKDKNRFNNSDPWNDAQFLHYVLYPSVPVLLNALFKTAIPDTPRHDLVSVYLTGVAGLNQPKHVKPAEMLRLNTSIKPTPPQMQNDLGVLGGDMAGYPNGRRPYDDVVDITLRAAEGALCGIAGKCGKQSSDPNKGAPFTDGARSPGPTVATVHVTGQENAADTYLDHFPYLMTAIPGSPNSLNGVASK